MNLLDLIQPECIKVPLVGADKESAINELVTLLGETHRLDDVETVRNAVMDRERTRSTGIGQGLAIPHCKSNACPRLYMAIGKPAQPIEFGSIDQKPVEMVILLVSPPDRTSDHIQVLARISRLMTMDDFRSAAYGVDNAEQLYRLFEQYESSKANV